MMTRGPSELAALELRLRLGDVLRVVARIANRGHAFGQQTRSEVGGGCMCMFQSPGSSVFAGAVDAARVARNAHFRAADRGDASPAKRTVALGTTCPGFGIKERDARDRNRRAGLAAEAFARSDGRARRRARPARRRAAEAPRSNPCESPHPNRCRHEQLAVFVEPDLRRRKIETRRFVQRYAPALRAVAHRRAS